MGESSCRNSARDCRPFEVEGIKVPAGSLGSRECSVKYFVRFPPRVAIVAGDSSLHLGAFGFSFLERVECLCSASAQPLKVSKGRSVGGSVGSYLPSLYNK